jgi:drug/metabolite transporter (DMT)-like permease
MAEDSAPLRTLVLTLGALFGFAANSLLCRLALGARAIDAASFTSLRVVSGALALSIIAQVARGKARVRTAGSWGGALALFGYALLFSMAYTQLAAGTGALILFGCVQLTMFGASLRAGQKPRAFEWLGLLLAFVGLVVLTLPGVSTPSFTAALFMACAGVAWGVYSLLGRASADALQTTAGNFLRASLFALLLSALSLRSVQLTPKGAALAVVSGALTSGVGYSLWYAALPRLSAARAGVIQLSVPVLTAGLGVVWLDEALTLQACVAALAILGGVLLALRARG